MYFQSQNISICKTGCHSTWSNASLASIEMTSSGVSKVVGEYRISNSRRHYERNVCSLQTLFGLLRWPGTCTRNAKGALEPLPFLPWVKINGGMKTPRLSTIWISYVIGCWECVKPRAASLSAAPLCLAEERKRERGRRGNRHKQLLAMLEKPKQTSTSGIGNTKHWHMDHSF